MAMVILGRFSLRTNEQGEINLTLTPDTPKLLGIPHEELFRKYGQLNNVDWKLIAAHSFIESSWRAKAKNPEGSFGLMQIFFPLAKNKGVQRHLQNGTLPEFENAEISRIYDPDYNISLGAALIRENIKTFGIPRAIAVYNSDTATRSPINGPFPNQTYVNKVRTKWEELTRLESQQYLP